MRLYVLALNPTDSVTEGFLPAAARLGLAVTLLTEPRYVAAHREVYGAAREVRGCAVRDFREVVAEIARGRGSGGSEPFAVFSNSDHLQAQTALAADYFGVPGKDWRVALRVKNKAETRRWLAEAGMDTVWCAELTADDEPFDAEAIGARYPCVVKPREGVASEDVVLAGDAAELSKAVSGVRGRRPGEALVVEEFLPGRLRTLETLGDGDGTRHVLGGFRTRLSAAPYFVEEGLTFEPALPGRRLPGEEQVLAQLNALGVGFGVCHTEYVTGDDGRARVIEVNYRAIGDQCDLMLAGLLGVPLFEHILRVHLGEPLPGDLGARTDGRARQEAPLADRAGTLTAAPGPCERTDGETELTYRPLRAIGEQHELHHTNRDYLGILRVTGTDQAAVDRATEGFLAAHRWEITP